jgi:gliding motility-associated-like protein
VGAYICSHSQTNLIQNPSFENVYSIPDNGSGIFYNLVPYWKAISITPDLYSVFSPYYLPNCTYHIYPWWPPSKVSVSIPKNCIGYQNPHHGNFYAGLFFSTKGLLPSVTNITSERMRGVLVDTLKKNYIYELTVYLSLANASSFYSNQFQCFFTKDTLADSLKTVSPYSNSYYLPNNFDFQLKNDDSFHLNDTLNWIKLSSCFKAKGGEKYIYIGNFLDSSSTKFYYNSKIDTFFNNSSVECSQKEYQQNHYFYCAYYYLDDLSLYERGYYGKPASAINDTIICPSNTILIGLNDTSDAHYLWYPNFALNCDTCPNPIASPSVSITYIVKKYLCDFVTYDTLHITVIQPPSPASAGNDTSICVNNTIIIGSNDTISPFISYSWQPTSFLSCYTCPSTTLITPPYPDTILYTLTKTFCNNSTYDTITIYILSCDNSPLQENFSVPNIFTPNNDGVNDLWLIHFSHPELITNFSLSIFNRWGIKLFETTKFNAGWDGRTASGEPVPTGTYYYVTEFYINNKKQELKGYLTLLR